MSSVCGQVEWIDVISWCSGRRASAGCTGTACARAGSRAGEPTAAGDDHPEKMPEKPGVSSSPRWTRSSHAERPLLCAQPFAAPTLDAATWRLRVEGAVKTPLELTLADLMQMLLPYDARHSGVCRQRACLSLACRERRTVGAWGSQQCGVGGGIAGKAVLDKGWRSARRGRSGVGGRGQWRAQRSAEAVRSDHFARSLPLAQAMRPEVLLTYRMYGAELPRRTRFPVTGRRARLVWRRVGEMADPADRDRSPLQRAFSVGGLCDLEAYERPPDAGADHGDAGEVRRSRVRICGRWSRQAPSTASSARPGPGIWRSRRSKSVWTAD